jgi:transglutaminase/protease-like cytokinesis protein 3
VPAGTGTDSVDLIVPLNIPIADNAYKIVLNLLPVGGDLNESLYEIRIVDVSVVSKLIPVESIGVDNCPSGDLTLGDTHQLTVKVLPADASNQSISWYSSDPSVLSVDENGLLSAVNAGTAYITVTTNDGGFISSCEINVVTSTDIKAHAMKQIEIFPNPSGDYINIQLPEALKRSKVTILNIQGKTIITNNIDNEQNQLDVSHLPSGVYIVRIESKQHSILKKFIKQ